MKKIFALLTILCAFMIQITAQEKRPTITFEKTTHDFGNFSEEKGKVTTEFKFTNTGKAPLLILRTAASCGCTTPEYPKEPIAPGKTGVIKVTYNAQGRPGAFQKTVYVIANTVPEKTTLIIKGTVTPTPKTIESTYNKKIGDLSLKNKYLPFFDIYPNREKMETIKVYNSGEKPIHVSFAEVPKYLHIDAIPADLPAKGEGEIIVTIHPEKANDWGMGKGYFKVLVNKKDLVDNKITYTYDIREDFSKLTKEQLSKAPVIQLQSQEIKFGNISEKATKSIEIRNLGKSDLIIRKIRNENRAFECKVNKTTIQPGKTAILKVVCDADKSTQRNINNHITIVTNDPKQTNTSVRLTAVIY